MIYNLFIINLFLFSMVQILMLLNVFDFDTSVFEKDTLNDFISISQINRLTICFAKSETGSRCG